MVTALLAAETVPDHPGAQGSGGARRPPAVRSGSRCGGCRRTTRRRPVGTHRGPRGRVEHPAPAGCAPSNCCGTDRRVGWLRRPTDGRVGHTGRPGSIPVLDRACRTEQWIEREGLRQEPLLGPGYPGRGRPRHARPGACVVSSIRREFDVRSTRRADAGGRNVPRVADAVHRPRPPGHAPRGSRAPGAAQRQATSTPEPPRGATVAHPRAGTESRPRRPGRQSPTPRLRGGRGRGRSGSGGEGGRAPRSSGEADGDDGGPSGGSARATPTTGTPPRPVPEHVVASAEAPSAASGAGPVTAITTTDGPPAAPSVRPKIGDTRPSIGDSRPGAPATSPAPAPSRSGGGGNGGGGGGRNRSRGGGSRPGGGGRSSSGPVPTPVDGGEAVRPPSDQKRSTVPAAKGEGRRGGRERRGKAVGRYQICVHVRPDMTQIALLEGRTLVEHYISRASDDATRSTATSTADGSRTCSRAWRRPSSTSARRRTPCSTTGTSATTPTTSSRPRARASPGSSSC